MNRRSSIKIISVLLSLILILSLPAGVAAEPVSSDVVNDNAIQCDSGEVVQGEDGEYYLLEFEDDDAASPDYDSSLLQEAKEALAAETTEDEYLLAKAAYALTVSTLPADTPASGTADFLSQLLNDRNIENSVMTGHDQDDCERSWVLVRFSDEKYFYILDASEDVKNTDGQWKGFLLGTEETANLTADEEYLTEAFTSFHPVSEKSYIRDEASEESADTACNEDTEVPEDAEDQAFITEEETEDGRLLEDVSLISIENADISLSSKSYTYNGTEKKPSVTVKYDGENLENGTDYQLSYGNCINAGTAYVMITGINDFSGIVKKTYTIKQKTISKAKVTGVKNLSYTGKARTQSSLKVKVEVNGSYVTLSKGTDYTVSYKRNKNVSTASSLALLTIKGKGNYKGSINKTFKILKASPNLSFEDSTLTKKAASGSFTRKAVIGVSADLTLTYKSSKTTVAEVNRSTGKVTPKKTGTVTISVSSKATGNYKSGKASYTLTVRALKLSEISYSFKNYRTSVIPYSTFQLFYNDSVAYQYYVQYRNAAADGCCFGLSLSSMMLNMGGSGLKSGYFYSGASCPKDFSWDVFYYTSYYKYKYSNVTLKEVVEAMQVSQFSSECSEYLWQKNYTDLNRNRIPGLVSAVKTGKPVLVAVTDPKTGGHALVAYKIKSISSSVSYLYVYDSTYPLETRYIVLYKTNGSYNGNWSYEMNSGVTWGRWTGGVLTYITAPAYKSIWKSKSSNASSSQMLISTDSFEISDSDGQVVAVMEDGSFRSYDEDVYISYSIGTELPDHLINLPKGEYQLINTDSDSEELEVTLLDTNQSMTVETEADSVTLNVNDLENINKTTIDAEDGESFEVTVISDSEVSGEAEQIVFTGEGTGEKVTVGTEDGSCILENIEDTDVSIVEETIECTAS